MRDDALVRLAARAALLGFLLSPAVVAAAPGPAGCGTGSWIAGTVEICDGELVYRDYVYDDYGAQGLSSPPSTGSLSNPTGTQSYPAPSDTVNNYADIAAIRLSLDGGQLHVTFELNSLFDASSTVAALAIDTDDDPATGGGTWGSLVAFPDFAVPLSSSGWDEIHFFTSGDPATNTIAGTIPLPPGSHWRLQAATAVAGTNVVMNVGFRGTGETGTWFEDQQAAALQDGDVSDFGHTVEVAKLTGGVTERAVAGPGLHERVYTSDYTIAEDGEGGIVYDTGAEGVNYDGISGRGVAGTDPEFSQIFHFVGRNQPYGIYLPSGTEPHGVQLVMHGYSANHASLIEFAGMQTNVGEALNRILVVPLGRGPAGFYSDISERDVLDVMSDVEANYPVDLERVFAGGYSMGGYGTLRMATVYPDRFAGYMNWVGYPGDACGQPDVQRCNAGEVGIAAEWLINLREVDGAHLYAGADELVNSAQGLWVRDQLAAAGTPHIHYYHPVAEHLTFAVLDDWMKEAAYTQDLVRRTQPPRVTYRTEPWADAPELGIVHDRAYWISEITGVATGERDYADIDILTFGCGGEERTFVQDAPGADVDPVPWESQSFSVSGATPITPDNRIEATLANIDSFFVDGSIAGACLDPNLPLDYLVTTDGPAEIRLLGHHTISLPGAGTFSGSVLSEPSGALALAAGATLLVALQRRQRKSVEPR